MNEKLSNYAYENNAALIYKPFSSNKKLSTKTSAAA
jgi:hypothetical protein